MRYIHFLTLTLCCTSAATLVEQARATPRSTQVHSPATHRADIQGGIRWETSLEAAKKKARRTRKPLLLLHLFGKLNEEFC